MKSLLISLILFACFLPAKAQQESNNWLFGSNVWLNFSSGSPVSVPGSAMVVTEGCASFSDTSGNLMFYTNGITVWDRNHQPMPNGTGLNGDNSSTQSAIVIPKPNSNYSIFYVFTCDADAGPNGVQYSEIDMTLNGGNGDVTANKNIPLLTPSCEKLTAVRHGANANEFWVIAHEWNTAQFFTYHVTASGVNTTPVISNTGVVHLAGTTPFITQPSHGYMKANMDGNKIALAVMNQVNVVQILDFDNLTGTLTNPVSLTGMRDPYGIEFSPSGRYLYTSLSSNPDTVFQFDLNAANIQASKQIAGVTPLNTIIYALQLANNGKIYMAQGNQNFLGVIDNPDTVAAFCGYALNAVPLNSNCRQGLPNFFVNLFITADYIYADTCFNAPTIFNLAYSGSPDSVIWDFGDPLSGGLNTGYGPNPQHTFSASGQFTVTSIVYDMGMTDTVVKTINIVPPPVAALSVTNAILCDGQSIWLNPGNNAADSVVWSTGSTADSIQFIANGQTQNQVIVQVFENGCVNSDTALISTYIYHDPQLGGDTTVCALSYLLDADPLNSPDLTFLWQDNSISDQFTVTAQGSNIYYVAVDNNGCTAYDTINVTLNPPITADLGNNITACPGDTTILAEQTGTAFDSYLWSDNSSGNTLTVTSPGSYWLVVTLGSCIDTGFVDVISLPAPAVYLGGDTIVCGSSHTLNADPAGGSPWTFLWQDGSTASTFNVTTSGNYTVTVSNGTCDITDSISVTINSALNLDLGPDLTICNNLPVPVTDINGTIYSIYTWSDGSSSATIFTNIPGTYILTVTDNGCVDRDTIELLAGSNPVVNLGPDTDYCDGDVITLNAGNQGASYLWHDGSTSQTITATSSGLYFVDVVSGGCNASDSVTLTFNPSPYIFPVTDTVICRGTTVFLDITNFIPGFTFQWSDGYPDPFRTISDAGTYSATVTAGNCTKTSSFTIRVLDPPTVNLGEDTVLCFGGIWILNASNPLSTYIWQDGSTGAEYPTNNSGVYGVQVTNQCGVDVDSVKLEYVECNCFVVFPKAFTPNHDLKNEVFNFKYDCLSFKSRMKIYNRWGALMFESNDPSLGWDGTYKGKDALPDVYVYVLEFEGVMEGNIKEEDKMGTFLLYR